MKDSSHISDPARFAAVPENGGSAEVRSRTSRRTFLQAAGFGAAAFAAHGIAYGAEKVVDREGNPILGFEDIQKASAETSKGWKPISDRKLRVGLVGYGYCKFGAAFGFQDHPNVEVVAVSDLIPERRDGLAKAARCSKTYDSLEEMVKDDKIEAIFCATDPPHHAQHCMEVLKHGKHVAVNVPAVWGSLEQAEQLYDAVKKAKGLKYMMFETSYFHPGLWAMRQLFQAGCFGNHICSEGEYYHYHDGKAPMPSFGGWRDGPPPLWYPTHSNAFYVGVTGKSFTHVSCQAKPGAWSWLKPGANKFNNTHATETALFRTADDGAFRGAVSYDTPGYEGEKGRFRGELGSFEEVAGLGPHWGAFNDRVNGKDLRSAALPNLDRPPLPPGVDPGGHAGSQGRLGHEFVAAILEDRTPLVHIADALNMTVAGVVASESAKKDGELLKIPQFAPLA